MPTQTSVLLDAMGPQVGYGMPFGGPYTNVYGTTPGAQSAENAYWDTLQRGYQNQSQQLVRDAYGKVKPSMMGDEYDWSNAISVDPTTESPRSITASCRPMPGARRTPRGGRTSFSASGKIPMRIGRKPASSSNCSRKNKWRSKRVRSNKPRNARRFSRNCSATTRPTSWHK